MISNSQILASVEAKRVYQPSGPGFKLRGFSTSFPTQPDFVLVQQLGQSPGVVLRHSNHNPNNQLKSSTGFVPNFPVEQTLDQYQLTTQQHNLTLLIQKLHDLNISPDTIQLIQN